MPRNFPDMDSLKWNAQCRNFRQPNKGESEPDYREALAAHVHGLGDVVEAMEIRSTKSWDQWDLSQTKSLLETALPGITSIFREEHERQQNELIQQLETADVEETRSLLDSLFAGVERQKAPDGMRQVFDNKSGTYSYYVDDKAEDKVRYAMLFSEVMWENQVRKQLDWPDRVFDEYSFSLTQAVDYNKNIGQVFCIERGLRRPISENIATILRGACERHLFALARFVVAEYRGERFILKQNSPFGTIHINKIADYALAREAYAFTPRT